MEYEQIKKELNEMRKLNKIIRNSLSVEEMYKERLNYLKSVDMEASNEFKIIERNLSKVQTLSYIKREAELEDKYLDSINSCSGLKRKIGFSWYVEAKSIKAICNELFIDKQSVYNRLYELNQSIKKEFSGDEI